MSTDKADKATFTSWKFDRLDEAMGDPKLTPAARVIAYWIMKHVNGHTLIGRVGLRTLMRESGFGVDTTDRGIKQLVAHGYFEKTPGNQGRGGAGNESQYRPLKKSPTIGAFKESDDRTLADEKESYFAEKRVRFCVEKSPTIGAVHLEHLKEHLDSCAVAVATRTECDDGNGEGVQTIERLKNGQADCSAGEEWLPPERPTYGARENLKRAWIRGEITEPEYWKRIGILDAKLGRGEMAFQQTVADLTPVKSPPIVPARVPDHPRKPKCSPHYSDEFQRFWDSYPKRDGANPKSPAQKKFTGALKSGVPLETILAGARGYRAECDRKGNTGTQYVAQAITWLNQQRWGDYQPAPEPPKRPKLP
jgi:hypothetical protein